MDASIVVRLIDETKSGFSDINRNLGSVNSSAKSLNNTMNGLAAATSAFVSALGVREILNFTNTIQSLENRLKLVTNSTEELNKVYGNLFQVAQDTRQPLDGTITLYGRLAMASENLKLTYGELAQLTSNFNKALSIGGATTAEAQSAMIQFSQALTSGKVEMQELRPLLDSAPVLMRELAKSLGLTAGEFRKFVSEGQITSEMLAKALLVATERLDEQFGKTSVTVGQATNNLISSFQRLAKEFLDSSGASQYMVNAIKTLEDNLLPVVIALGSFAAALAIGSLIQVVTFALGGLTVAVKGLSTALLFLGGTPLGRVVSLLGLAAGALVAFKGDAKNAEESSKDLGASQQVLGQNVGKSNEELRKMEKELQAQVQAMKGANSELAKFNEKLQQEIALAGLDSEEKQRQQLLYEGFKAQAKDLGKTIQQLTEAEKAQVQQVVDGAITTIKAKNEEAETRKRVYKEATDLLNRFAEDSRKSQNQNLTETEKFNRDLFDIEIAYQNAMLNSKGKSREELLKIEKDYMDAVKGVHMRGLNDLVREYDKYTVQTKSRTEQFQMEKAKIEEAYQIAMKNSHNMTLEEQKAAYENYQKAIQGLQNKYGNELKKQAEDFRTSELDSNQKYQKRMQELDNEYYNLGTISHQDYLTLKRKAEKEYVEEAIREYSNLYGLLNEQLLKWSGLSQKEFGIVKDTFKLIFGVDIEDLIKQFFAMAIREILGFRTAATGDLNGIGGVMQNIFSDNGSGIGFISAFVSKALDLFKGLGSGVSGIFGSIFDGIGSIFSKGGGGGGGGILGTIGDIVGGIGDIFGGGLGDIVGSIGGGLGDIFGGGLGDLLGGAGSVLGTVGAAASSILAPAAAVFGVADFLGLFSGSDQLDRDLASGKAYEVQTGMNPGYGFRGNPPTYTQSTLTGLGKAAEAYSITDMGYGRYVIKDKKTNQTVFDRKLNVSGITTAYPSLPTNQAILAYAGSGRTDFGANGLAFDQGNVVKYALGGLINRPTMFGTTSGIAIAGEAGTEAILPLSRGGDGELGVNAEGMNDINVSFTIHAVDAQGIDQLLVERKQLITNIVANAVRQKGRSFA